MVHGFQGTEVLLSLARSLLSFLPAPSPLHTRDGSCWTSVLGQQDSRPRCCWRMRSTQRKFQPLWALNVSFLISPTFVLLQLFGWFSFSLSFGQRWEKQRYSIGNKGKPDWWIGSFFLWADRKREGLLFYVESNGVKFTGFVSWRSLNQTPKRQSMHHIL